MLQKLVGQISTSRQMPLQQLWPTAQAALQLQLPLSEAPTHLRGLPLEQIPLAHWAGALQVAPAGSLQAPLQSCCPLGQPQVPVLVLQVWPLRQVVQFWPLGGQQ